MTLRIYTVPTGVPFLRALADAMLAGKLPNPGGAKPDPLSLPDITLLLPTRRAARAAQDAFLASSGRKALLMPRIRPISEGEEDLGLLKSLASGETVRPDDLDMEPAISPLARTLTLMQLVQHWRKTIPPNEDDLRRGAEVTPAQSANLAAELAGLMDEIERENVALAGLKELVPDTYSEHWKLTVDFLRIVTEFWPAHLGASGQSSPVARRNAVILAEAKRIAASPPGAPVVVAGITGSIPATVELMRAVLAHDGGAIVLPALDQSLDEASWEMIVPDHPEHPQYGLKKLLDGLGVARRDVTLLPGITANPARDGRAAFISEAMRPSATTAEWHDYAQSADATATKAALEGISLIVAPNAQDEAEAVALILREAVETPGKTAALVSPDRLLARRVAIRLEAWGIRVDDSAGRPFAKTVPGTFLALVAEAAVHRFAPAQIMSLLKHPLCRLGLAAFDVRRFGRALEISAFRAPYLGKGLDGIAAALKKSERDAANRERLHPAASRLWDEDRAGARDVVARLSAAFAPLSKLYDDQRPHTLRDFAEAHATVAEAIAVLPVESDTDKETVSNPLWQGEAGALAQAFFMSLLDPAMPEIAIQSAGYADLYRSLLARENVRERSPVHPRVAIWGPFEARLQQADVIVLGSLNEGTWPEAAEPGAWLNRPMRQSLKLPAPEEDIGRAAHDFASLLGAERVYLTRAQKINGVPTVPSRWLMRISALLGGMNLSEALKPDQPWLAWARARDAIDETKRIRIAAPEPRPSLSLRPRRMSVTRVQDWMTNPYAVYARAILKLEPLPALGQSPDQSLRGALVHEVLSRFASQYPAALPPDFKQRLDTIAADVLTSYTGHARVAAFWMPRLARFLEWFAAGEAARRDGVSQVIAETSGSLVLDAPGGPFTLTARADRIDNGATGLVITDYKTGVIPNDTAVRENRAPQLPLEAAIALGQSGFPGLSGKSVAALRYIRASGGEPPGEEKRIKVADIAALAADAQRGLERLVADFDDAATPYRAIRRPGFRYEYDDYAHLARVAEWSAHAEDDGGA